MNQHFIDLKELAQRESERVEWKENGDDVKIVSSIVKTISAFANDVANVGGGYVVCGAKESKDEYGFPQLEYRGLSAEKLKTIAGKVLQHCRDYVSPSVAPLVEELENPMDSSTRILVFMVVASPEAHTYRDGESANYYVRVGRDTKEARNGVLAQLLIKKQKIQYFDKRTCLQASTSDIDILLFRDSLGSMGLLQTEKTLEDYFSEREQIAEFVPPLFQKIGIENRLFPLNFTLLLFGKKASISRFFPDAYTLVSIYKGKDRSEPTSERHTLTGTIIEQAKRAIQLLSEQVYTILIKIIHNPTR